jgi:hypothetical protein
MAMRPLQKHLVSTGFRATPCARRGMPGIDHRSRLPRRSGEVVPPRPSNRNEEESIMKKLILIAGLGLCAIAGVAAADGDSGDSSMNPYTGDSWAALQGGGHNLGYNPRAEVKVFIAKRAARAAAKEAAAKEAAAKESAAKEPAVEVNRERVTIAFRGTPTNPFRDDTAC